MQRSLRAQKKTDILFAEFWRINFSNFKVNQVYLFQYRVIKEMQILIWRCKCLNTREGPGLGVSHQCMDRSIQQYYRNFFIFRQHDNLRKSPSWFENCIKICMYEVLFSSDWILGIYPCWTWSASVPPLHTCIHDFWPIFTCTCPFLLWDTKWKTWNRLILLCYSNKMDLAIVLGRPCVLATW